ncbi:MAG: hypothetical protein IJU76_10115 [Desulfovibrionaceae bacterium]|nr:hypothetical protein [Desulfovibrionaceae bacterium]
MKKLTLCLVFLAHLFLVSACGETPTAKSALANVALALEQNNASLFLAHFDLKACAAGQIRNMTDANDALYTLDKLGKSLGIGGMEDLLGNLYDVEHSLKQNFVKKVSTGALVQECSRSDASGCPWVPDSLRRADVRKVDDSCAIARIVSPAKMTTWLALAKRGERWMIVGWADLEETAKRYALGRDEILKAPAKNGTTI